MANKMRTDNTKFLGKRETGMHEYEHTKIKKEREERMTLVVTKKY